MPDKQDKRMMELKTWPVFFKALVDGTKTFEVRNNDRGFLVGDILILKEWDPDTEKYTGRVEKRRVSYVFHGIAWVGEDDYHDDYVVLGFEYTRLEEALSLDEAVEEIWGARLGTRPVVVAKFKAILTKYRGGDVGGRDSASAFRAGLMCALTGCLSHVENGGECEKAYLEKSIEHAEKRIARAKKHSKGKPSHCHDCPDVFKPDCPIQSKEQYAKQGFEDEPHLDCPRKMK